MLLYYRNRELPLSLTFLPKSESFENSFLTALRSIENNYLCRNCLAKLKKWWGLITQIEKKSSHPGGVGLLLYISHIGICATPSGRVFAPFWSENGYKLCPFWSGIRYGFQGNYVVYNRIYHFNSKWVRKKEKYANNYFE